MHPDPYTAALHVVHDERVDEIIVSTFPGERSGWLRRDLVERLRKDTGLPVDHVDLAGAAQAVTRMSAAAEAHEHHGPPPIHYSSRVSPAVLGMFLFIASEIMLFGSFFTVYFFDRVVNHGVDGALAAGRASTGPSFVARHQHADPRHVELHDALGRHVDQEGQPRGPAGRPRADAAASARRSCSRR